MHPSMKYSEISQINRNVWGYYAWLIKSNDIETIKLTCIHNIK
jgi:hypothetical protein